MVLETSGLGSKLACKQKSMLLAPEGLINFVRQYLVPLWPSFLGACKASAP